ncbi:GNAT family N-acetyltransferase [Euzebyella saccharophila]|uniref:GNAT family N-acetyltransferase n=1 Tax=Euzebyella saccharophila TaxID=679664 RepID=A0ABV8JWD1_9FLAO|nr:GNAT family N-acetyltransferase [Euzebyella saccharophila]
MYKIRRATRKDVPEIIALLANDKLGELRENFKDPLPETYYTAFEKIQADANQHLMVLADAKGSVIGTLQLSFLQYLTYQGGIRSQIEAVRVHPHHRGKGLGRQLFEWAIEFAEKNGAHLIQLTTDKKRPEALAFYKELGFTASHEGMKLHF